MENRIAITRARHAWPEKAGFIIDRPKGLPEYTFLHFHNSVEILVQGEVVTTPPGAVIFYSEATPQWFHSPGPLIHDWMHLQGEATALLLESGLEPDRLYFPGNSRFITPILRQIELEVLTKQPGGEALMELKLRELLILLARSCAQQEEKAGRFELFVEGNKIGLREHSCKAAFFHHGEAVEMAVEQELCGFAQGSGRGNRNGIARHNVCGGIHACLLCIQVFLPKGKGRYLLKGQGSPLSRRWYISAGESRNRRR